MLFVDVLLIEARQCPCEGARSAFGEAGDVLRDRSLIIPIISTNRYLQYIIQNRCTVL